MTHEEDWQIIYTEYDPDEEPKREALCTLGNGYFATRGAAEECGADAIHYPGTYLAGGYNRLKSEVAGKIIENEDLVNWPNWLVLKFKIGDGDWISPEKVTLLEYKQVLDLKCGVTSRTLRFRDANKKESILITRRIVHMGDHHLAAIEWELVPLNWSERVTIHTGLDGTVINNGVKRYRELNGNHLGEVETGRFDEDGIFLKTSTRQSEITMAQASKTKVLFPFVNGAIERETVRGDGYIAQELSFDVNEKQKIRIEKTVAVFTSRDHAISNPLTEAKMSVSYAGRFEELLNTHHRAWARIWHRCDVALEKNRHHQRMLRLHIFHVFQTISFNSIDLDVGVPARGWHGEAYRGHILWDELFIFPFLNLSVPEITRELLMYRYRRLPEARRAAHEAGFEGAMFPWQCGSNGREESQHIHLNPQSGRWIPDNTYLQRHVSAAISYNVWQYYQATHDLEFMSFYGAEMLLDIARFWASIASFNEESGRYEIHGVVGPDEYHTMYPGAETPGLRNNAYTNIMAVNSLIHALEVLELLDSMRKGELLSQLQIEPDELDRWEKISHNMYVPFTDDGKIISQFDGYEELKEFDWDHYKEEHGEILRLDRILEKENDSPDNYKAGKQADVLMLFYLFSSKEITTLFERLGYDFDPEHIPDNIEYYSKRTSHGSTLSKLVTSWVTARSHREMSWENFKKALISDFEDIQGGTTPEGIHLGAMAGTIDLIQRCYTGFEMREDAIFFNPHLPQELERICFRFRYRGQWIVLDLTQQQLRLTAEGSLAHKIKVVVEDEVQQLDGTAELVFDLHSKENEIEAARR